MSRERRRWPIAVALAGAALAAALASPPGRAVLGDLREVVGVERAQPALFSLPAGGRLLVASDAGVWVAAEDGSRDASAPTARRAGRRSAASWSRLAGASSPHSSPTATSAGRSLGRRRLPALGRHGGGHEDRLPHREPPARRRRRRDRRRGRGRHASGGSHRAGLAPGPRLRARLRRHARSRHRVRAASGRCASEPVRSLTSCRSTGRRATASRRHGRRCRRLRRAGTASPSRAFAWCRRRRVRADGRRIAILRRAELFVVDTRSRTTRRVFAGAEPLDGLAWSPDGRWLLVGWPAADQWVFVRADGRRIRAVSNVSEQFRSRSFPRVEGWCCSR